MQDNIVGSTVWFEEPWSGLIQQGQVESLKIDPYNEEEVIYTIKMNTFSRGSICKRSCDCFDSYNSCKKFIEDREEKRVNELKENIVTVEDLLRFMFNHTVARSEEYTDWTARQAAKESAYEILGIDLEDD